MKKLKLLFVQKQSDKGQSFVEMIVFLVVLLILALGVVEFGNLLNQYINLVDGAREGARFGSTVDPFAYEDAVGNVFWDYSYIQPSFFEGIDQIVTGLSNHEQAGAIAPMILDEAEDEVMIYFLSIQSGKYYVINHNQQIWCKFDCSKHPRSEALVYSNASFIYDSLDTNAPNTGALIVEIFYAYHQIINSPIFTAFVPNPIEVHAYTIMPLSAGEPTPTPCSGSSCFSSP